MRDQPISVLVANWTDRIAGGAERYLHDVLPELERDGCDLAFLHEGEEPLSRERVAPHVTRRWSVVQRGREDALAEARRWKPDLVFIHGLRDPTLEEALQALAPSVLVAHSFYGSCVSGTKTWTSPQTLECRRPFGLGCVAHYYPHRCGGLSPITLIRQYRLQSRRNHLLPRYGAVVALSRYMEQEMARSGAPAIHVPLAGEGHHPPGEIARRDPELAWRLLFVGRMHSLKGGQMLLDALPMVRAATGAPLEVAFVGDGPDRCAWEGRAQELQRRDAGLSVEFTGWLEGDALEAQWRQADLFVFPSLWPEPFGLVGLDASRHGVPAAAFRVGAVTEWLEEGVNGHLAPGDPATPAGLAGAIAAAIGDPGHFRDLKVSTVRRGLRLAVREHARGLMGLFESLLAPGRPAAHGPIL